MSTGQLLYLGLVLAGFAVFMVVLSSTCVYVWLGDQKSRRAAAAMASGTPVGPVIAPPVVAETVEVGGKVSDVVAMH
jgi:MFS family permease